MMFYSFFRGFYKKAAKRMVNDCKSFIPLNSKILDFGCGSAIVAREFEESFKSEIIGIDIIDNRVENIPFKLYDGKDISFFDDNSFDVVLVSYVLHHTNDPIGIFKRDIKRVAKDIVIVYESPCDGLFYKLMCRIHGTSFARFFQKNSIEGKFFTTKEWGDVFKENGFKIVKEKIVNNFPLRNTLFILKKGV
jgi:SAM-dependent methyltransferase